MATVESNQASVTTSHARIRIRIGDTQKQIGPDRLDDLLPQARTLLGPDIERGVKEEIERVRSHGLGEACSEIISIAQALAPAGHRLELLGPPVSLKLFHLAGLTHFDPLEYRFQADAWLPIPDTVNPPAPWALPASPSRHIGVTVSMAPADLVTFLRLRGYAIRSERFSYEKVNYRDLCFDQITAKQYPSTPDHQTVILLVSTDSLTRLSAAVTPEESIVCLRDTQTFHLLAAADTDGLGPLRYPEMKRLLRQRRPSSLEELAALLDGVCDTRRPRADQEEFVYLEDLLLELNQTLGISLSDARATYSLIGLKSGGDKHRGWIVERAMSRGMDAAAAEAFWSRLCKIAENRAAASRTQLIPLAHKCLRAAFLKAHYPAHFRAILAAEGPG